MKLRPEKHSGWTRVTQCLSKRVWADSRAFQVSLIKGWFIRRVDSLGIEPGYFMKLKVTGVPSLLLLPTYLFPPSIWKLLKCCASWLQLSHGSLVATVPKSGNKFNAQQLPCIFQFYKLLGASMAHLKARFQEWGYKWLGAWITYFHLLHTLGWESLSKATWERDLGMVGLQQ